MTQLILIRHGETEWNTEGRWQGQVDVPLNSKGWVQAHSIAAVLLNSPISVIYSSDLQRAQDTAQVLADVKGLQVLLDPRLREIHQGEWQGLLINDIQKLYAKAFIQRQTNPLWVAPPGGETAIQVRERALASIQDIRQAYPDQSIAVVSHGFIIAVILAYYHNTPFEQVWDLIPKNGEINYLQA